MERETVKIHEKDDLGVVHISKEVVAIIASLAAIDVEGVEGMVGDFTGDLVELLGRKNLAKGVAVNVEEDIVSLTMSLVLKMGVNVVECSSTVQDKVKKAIENMTGLKVESIDLNIAGIKAEK